VADDDAAGIADLTGERRADVAHEVRIELLADDPSDVVGLEDAGQVTHQWLPEVSGFAPASLLVRASRAGRATP
jgi:hypothetical protein